MHLKESMSKHTDLSKNLILKECLLFISDSSFAAAAAKSFQSCPTLCDPIDSSPPGSPVPGSLQARTLEWVQWEKKATVPLTYYDLICILSP